MVRATLLLALLFLCQHAQAEELPNSVRTLVILNDEIITLASSGTPGEVAISFAGAKEFAKWQLPKSAGNVTEIVAAPWMSGLAWAVEATNEDGQRSYYWATTYVNAKDKRIGVINGGVILQTKQDLDLVGIRNSVGDSIYITLLEHRRNDDTPLGGYAFIHNCPITGPLDRQAPLGGAHRLLRLTSSASDMKTTQER